MLDVRDPAGVDLEVLSDRGIAPAVRAVLERPEHHWSVGELAALCSHSRSSFVERFRQLTGESPIRFVTRCRLARAAGQLRTTSASVGEVAHLAGYESAFAFSRAFKRAFGVSPQAYRAQR
jgi:AraC family transcriptional activator of mtrCDE